MITLVLKQDVKGLGKKGDIVSVKPGYAHNYIIPKGLGVIANQKDIEIFEKHKQFMRKTIAERDKLFAEIDDVIQNVIKKRGLMIRRSANNKGVLYDKVDRNELRSELLTLIPELDVFKVDVKLDEPLEKLGKHAVDVSIAMENRKKVVTIIVDVVSTQKEAKMKYSEIKKQLKQKAEQESEKGTKKKADKP